MKTWMVLFWTISSLATASVQADTSAPPNTGAETSWSSLWSTPDQQAQRALDAGDAKRAAQLFTDPRRRAYADIQAHQYGDAAKQLAAFDDPESQYNRGNALARSGDLKSALDAYDAVLKHAPADAALRRDAQHNRDLVARQLQNQAQSGQQGSKNSGQQKSDESGQESSAQANGGKDGKDGNEGPSNPPSAESARNSGGAASKGGDGTDQSGGGADKGRESASKGSEDASQGGGGAGHSGEDAGQSAGAAGKGSESAGQSGGAAHQSESASKGGELASGTGERESGQARSAEAAPSRSLDGSGSKTVKPASEQTLSMDQWLRQIPDDPGGLLRRKFMIEHMLKQGEQP